MINRAAKHKGSIGGTHQAFLGLNLGTPNLKRLLSSYIESRLFQPYTFLVKGSYRDWATTARAKQKPRSLRCKRVCRMLVSPVKKNLYANQFFSDFCGKKVKNSENKDKVMT